MAPRRAEHHGAQLAIGIFEGEIRMAALDHS